MERLYLPAQFRFYLFYILDLIIKVSYTTQTLLGNGIKNICSCRPVGQSAQCLSL